jgi:hypothetical protein
MLEMSPTPWAQAPEAQASGREAPLFGITFLPHTYFTTDSPENLRKINVGRSDFPDATGFHTPDFTFSPNLRILTPPLTSVLSYYRAREISLNLGLLIQIS